MNSGSNIAGSECRINTAVPEVAEMAAPEFVEYFRNMIDHCYDYVEAAKAQKRPVVGILCEFTPREVILAAGAIPVCLCGGAAETIPAAEQFLPANLCPLIKSTFGYHVTGKNPFLNWADLVVAETTCDGKKKMFELMSAQKPMYVLELPQKAADPDALAHWTGEVRKLKEHLENRFGVQITKDRLRDSIRLMNGERSVRRELASLMTSDQPPFSGRQLLEFKSILSGNPADMEQYRRALGHYSDAAKRNEKGSRTVRVLLTGVPLVHGAERVVELIEGCGATVVSMENCTGLKPIQEDVDTNAPDPITAIAKKYYHLPCSVMTHNRARFEMLHSLTAQFRPECVIELVWQACLTYDVESFFVRKLVEEEFKLPYLKITTDYSTGDSARIIARVQALMEIVRAGW
jgi:benzoyl-CoA reductase/2-hydroxyglutaryl-CoA dehydratase subunit BcrC/BadD/HgdB